jgi:hypothetical protein
MRNAGIDIRKNNTRTMLSKQLRARAPYPARGAGNDRHFPFQQPHIRI